MAHIMPIMIIFYTEPQNKKKGIIMNIKNKTGSLLLLILVLLGCNTIKQEEVDKDTDMSKYEWELVWSDEFESSQIDTEKWNFINGAGGYGNNELQNYTGREKNVRIEGGNLILEAHKEDLEGSEYTSAKVTTEGKGDWTYGRFEIRAKLPIGQGIWPAFWMMPSDQEIYGPWPSCGEIDIMEALGHEPNTTYGTLHYGNPRKYSGTHYVLEKENFNDNYHTFTVDWLPGEIIWYVDGKEFQRQNEWFSNSNEAPSNLAFPAPFDRDFFMQFNLAVGGNWPGNPDSNTNFPQQLIIDWIRVYEPQGSYDKVKLPLDDSVKTAAPGRKPQDSGNYVLNDLFDNDQEFWTFSNHEGGSGTTSVVDNELHMALTAAGGQSWANQLFQTDMNVRQDHKYRVSFKARSAEDRSMMVKIGGLEPRGWAAYSGEHIIKTTTEMKEYSFEFLMAEKTDITARFEFNMGLSDTDIWLDDIQMILLESPTGEKKTAAHTPLKYGNLIYNGGFDRGNERTEYWEMASDPKSDAMLIVNPELYKREAKVVTLDSSGEENAIILYQENIDVQTNESYTLKFDAYSTKARAIKVALLDENNKEITEKIVVELNKEKQEYSTVFDIVKGQKNIKVSFIFVDGKNTQTVYLDNVTFIKMNKPTIVNGNTRIEAEDFFSKSDIPQSQECSEGGLNIGWMTEGNWLKYRLKVDKPGLYTIRYRVASEKQNMPIQAESDIDISKVIYEGSGDWQNWESIENQVKLPEGESILTISAVDVNINWIELEIMK